MKKIIYIIFIGLFGLLLSCEKDGTQVVMLENPIAPTIATMPDLTLERNNGTDTLEFIGTPVDPGFQASAKYFLEADTAGNNFANSVIIATDVQANSFKITVSDLNGILLKKFPGDVVASAEFRIRTSLIVDAGTGAQSFEYSSTTTTANVTLYGLPRLDLIDSGLDQKIESALGNGVYKGFVKLDATMPFTLLDPDTDTEYGANGANLEVGATGIAVGESGWYILSADINELTYSTEAYMIGIIGSATPNGWNSPDTKMDYNAQTGLWYITLDLTVGAFKIRANDAWGAINLGLGDDDHPGYSLTNLWNDGGSKDIPITEAGNYTITVFIGTDTYSCTITKN